MAPSGSGGGGGAGAGRPQWLSTHASALREAPPAQATPPSLFDGWQILRYFFDLSALQLETYLQSFSSTPVLTSPTPQETHFFWKLILMYFLLLPHVLYVTGALNKCGEVSPLLRPSRLSPGLLDSNITVVWPPF